MPELAVEITNWDIHRLQDGAGRFLSLIPQEVPIKVWGTVDVTIDDRVIQGDLLATGHLEIEPEGDAALMIRGAHVYGQTVMLRPAPNSVAPSIDREVLVRLHRLILTKVYVRLQRGINRNVRIILPTTLIAGTGGQR